MKIVCETLGVARSNIAARAACSPSRARGRPPLPDRELVEEIKAVIADMPTYGYRRVHAILRRNARKAGRSWPNAKRVYRVMKVHNLLLVRHTGVAKDRLHDGRVAVERSNIRWCSDGFEIGCDNKEKVRVAFALAASAGLTFVFTALSTRLLGARDGWNYLATPITADKGGIL